MSERKFRADKLYKLVRYLVIIITTISLLLAIGSFSRLTNLDCSKQYPPIGNDYIHFDACLDEQTGYRDALFNNIKIAILLPILFFGGTWLYKYLFPPINKSK